MKRLGLYLGVIGVVIVIFAMNMDITAPYSDVVNLGLISERQNYLIMGGFVFLAGVVMFASAKIKETPEEEAESRRVSQENKLQFEELSKKNAASIQGWFARRENKGLRLFVLVFTYLSIMALTDDYKFFEDKFGYLSVSFNEFALFKLTALLLLVTHVIREISASTIAKQSALLIIGLVIMNLVFVLLKYHDDPVIYSKIIGNVFFIILATFMYWVASSGKKK